MKTRLVFLFTVFVLSVKNVQSQQGFQRQTVEERVKLTADKIAESLLLDPEQKRNTQNAYTEYYKRLDKLRDGSKGATRPEKPIIDKFANDRDQKLKGIFTAEQFIKFKSEVEPALRRPRNEIPVNY